MFSHLFLQLATAIYTILYFLFPLHFAIFA
jgi:hypothetical protein